MATLRKTFLAAIVKSLLRGKTLIQAILAYCVSPLAIKGKSKGRATAPTHRNIQDFLKEAEALFLGPVSGDGLQKLSEGLKAQFLDRLQTSMECMLPSYSHQLPQGIECGRFLALDVGGSTLRVALVELRGRTADNKQESEIVSMKNFFISPEIKDLEGMAFFDWMAERIKETLETGFQPDHSPNQPIPAALAWSFAIEQTSVASGKLQPMGKNFMAHRGLVGQDLGQVVKLACENHGLNVELRAIVNDSSACLLSRSYSHTSTRFGLILGTGVNVAAYLPVSAIGRVKFGERPDRWYSEASHVIVNTEMSMFGYDILPWTRWDRQLLAGHSRPDFQPLELLVSGMYLGEIGRFALIEAIETTGVFGGVVPPSLIEPYSLASETLSSVQGDTSSDLAEACKIFSTRHPSSHIPTTADLSVLKDLASYISVRSSALVAACVHASWDLRIDSQKAYIASLSESSPLLPAAKADLTLEETTVAFNGSVIEHYPGYLASCQRYVDDLVNSRGKSSESLGSIRLVPAKESSLLGAAIALACVEASS